MMRRVEWKLAGIALACAALPFMIPDAYLQRLINLVGLYSILALGLALVLSYTGLLSLGHAAFFGIGAYTSALLAVDLHWPFWAGLPAAALVSVAAAVLIGIPVLRLGTIYLALATIAFNELVVIVLTDWDAVTRGASGIPNIPPPAAFGFVFSSQRSYYYLILAGLALTYLVIRQLLRSHVGRAFTAIREDALAAESLGVNTTFYKVLSFAIGAFFAGIAGSLQAHYLSLVSPGSFTDDLSLTLLAMIVLGGRTLWAPILGAALITLVPEIARPLVDYRLLAYGIVLIVMMIVRPQGLVAPRRRRALSSAKRGSHLPSPIAMGERP